MSSEDAAVITTQPKSKKKEIDSFVRDLDPTQVADWSENDVVDRFLRPIGMEFMAKAFIENKVNGTVLMALTEEHMKEMGCCVLGDRILFLEYLTLLKKHKRDADRSRAVWSATTPVRNCAYHENCCSFFCYNICPCCVPTVEWRITGQGIRWRKNRATINVCGDVETQFIDYRFMKDLELRRDPTCCCFCRGNKLLIYADDKDSVSTRQAKSAVRAEGELEPVVIRHPDCVKAESLLRNAWADAKLVAD